LPEPFITPPGIFLKYRMAKCGETSRTATWLKISTKSMAMTDMKMRFSGSGICWNEKVGKQKFQTKRNGAMSICITSIID